MINLLTVSEIPTVDPDFDDLELLYSDDEVNIPFASEEEERIYKLWLEWDERHQDKVTRRSK